MNDLAKELFAALLRKPDYGAPPAQPSRWRVMSAADLDDRNARHVACDGEDCECAAPSKLKYRPRE